MHKTSNTSVILQDNTRERSDLSQLFTILKDVGEEENTTQSTVLGTVEPNLGIDEPTERAALAPIVEGMV